MIKFIQLKDRCVTYELQRKNVKNINLRIKPDLTVYVSANEKVSQATIEEFLLEKQEYIVKAILHYEEMSQLLPKPKKYVDGETFKVLGHDRRLKVMKGLENFVESDEAYITLTVKNVDDYALKKSMIERWLNKLCREQVMKVCLDSYSQFKKHGVEFQQLKFKNMVSMWGSCSPKRNTITFNYALVQAPLSCIEYVVVHEFTHFLHPNHSKKFYNQLCAFMPDWEERKERLERVVVLS